MCTDCDWSTYLHIARDASQRADDIPERGEDFVASVQETLNDIAEWIEENAHVSGKQAAAIENMAAGVERWLD